jgi:hypothetical protein
MDKDAAKLALQACRPNGHDNAHPVVAEALALVESDPELKTWWEAQHEFNRKVAAKLEEIPLPPDLRATILSGHKIEKLTPRFRLPYWLAAAAAVVFFLVIGFHPWTRPSVLAADTMAHHAYTASILQFLVHDPVLGLTTDNHEKILAWLQEQKSPVGEIPAGMTDISSLGCQKLDINGHTVSLICFSLAGGEVVHLFIIDRQALADPPGSSPEFDRSSGWSTALWSDGTKSYLLATQGDTDTLKRLL